MSIYFLINTQNLGRDNYVTAHKSKKKAYLEAMNYIEGAWDVIEQNDSLEDSAGNIYFLDSNPTGYFETLIDWKASCDYSYRVLNMQAAFEYLANHADNCDSMDELTDEIDAFRIAIENFYK